MQGTSTHVRDPLPERPGFFVTLQMQAGSHRAAYRAFVPRKPRRFMEALALAARQARIDAGRKQVHVAAALDADQSTVARFERGQRPRDLEAMLLAYSDDTGLSPRELVERALDLWEYPGNGTGR